MNKKKKKEYSLAQPEWNKQTRQQTDLSYQQRMQSWTSTATQNNTKKKEIKKEHIKIDTISNLMLGTMFC